MPKSDPAEVDARNTLNDLTNREFMRRTKSFWVVEGGEQWGDGDGREVWEEFVGFLREKRGDGEAERLLGQIVGSVQWSKTPPRDRLKHQHPATFSERDVAKLIELFSQSGERVLDPLVGTGSALLACAELDREGTGIELSSHWADIARQRLATTLLGQTQTLLVGDATEQLERLPADHFHFVVTSPPYWSILRKKAGMKARQERVDRGLDTKYSDDPADLGNIEDYDEFLAALEDIWHRCARVLIPGRYMAVIVSDFRHGPRFYLYHADTARGLERAGLPLKAITILVQDNKNLYPFGVPRHFVSNIHHQYILIHQRPAD